MWANEHHEEIERLICSKCDADKNRDYSPCKDCKRRDDFELGYVTASERNGWHDLRKNPDDLPNDGEKVLASNLLTAEYVRYDDAEKSWKHDYFELDNVRYWKREDFPEGD